MKSIVLSQKAFASELFFAFTRELTYTFYDVDGVELETVTIFAHATTHVFMIELRSYDSQKQEWIILHSHSIPKGDKRMNSIEGYDITEYIRDEYLFALRAYQINVGYLMANDQLIKRRDHPKFRISNVVTGEMERNTWMEALIQVKELIIEYGFTPADVVLDRGQIEEFNKLHGKNDVGSKWYPCPE